MALLNSRGGLLKNRRINVIADLIFDSVGDSNGIAYYLGTNQLTQAFGNPHDSGVLEVISNSWRSDVAPINQLVNRVNNGSSYTADVANAWVGFDLKSYKLRPNYYSFKHDANVGYYARNWRFEGSNNFTDWTIIDTQTNNNTINSPFSWVATPVSGSIFYRYLRIFVPSAVFNSSGGSEICVSEIEMYGSLTN